jgi:hypothetical protein
VTFTHLLLYLLLCCAAVIAVAFTWGVLDHTFSKREPLRLATSSHRRLRWLAAEIQKELDKTEPLP